MLLILLTVAACLSLLEAAYSLITGWQFFRTFQRFQRPPKDFNPPVTLILPCKGIDPGMDANLEAYFSLNYPDFRLMLVTSDENDPCVPVIKRVRQRFPQQKFQLLYAGLARGRGQKVHNLLFAVNRLNQNHEVIAFGDSDIRPHRQWLMRLVERLEDSSAGVSTGFRWYVPSREARFSSILRSAWNAGILTLMSPGDSPFAWGGAMAIRRQTFESCQVARYWGSALSDDFALSKAVHECGLDIRFQPHCLSFTYEDCGWKELFGWIYRQLAITRVYHPWMWRIAFVAQTLHSLAFWGGLLVLLGGLGEPSQGSLGVILAALVLAIYVLGGLKGWFRLKSLYTLFPQKRFELGRITYAYVLLGPVTSLLSLVGFFRSMVSREIEWRGIRYRMISASKTKVLQDSSGTNP